MWKVTQIVRRFVVNSEKILIIEDEENILEAGRGKLPETEPEAGLSLSSGHLVSNWHRAERKDFASRMGSEENIAEADYENTPEMGLGLEPSAGPDFSNWHSC